MQGTVCLSFLFLFSFCSFFSLFFCFCLAEKHEWFHIIKYLLIEQYQGQLQCICTCTSAKKHFGPIFQTQFVLDKV